MAGFREPYDRQYAYETNAIVDVEAHLETIGATSRENLVLVELADGRRPTLARMQRGEEAKELTRILRAKLNSRPGSSLAISRTTKRYYLGVARRRPFELEVVPEPGRTTVTWRDPGAWGIGAAGAAGLGALLMAVSALGIAKKKPTPYGPIVCAFILLLVGAWLFWNGRKRRVRVVMTPETIDSALGIREPLEGIDYAEMKSVIGVDVVHQIADPERKNGWQVRVTRNGAPPVMLALFRSSEPAAELRALITKHLSRYPTPVTEIPEVVASKKSRETE